MVLRTHYRLGVLWAMARNQAYEGDASGWVHVILLDSTSFRRKKVSRKLARGKTRLLFFPPHSPDCNRIKKTWANVKHFLCSSLGRFVSVEFAVYVHFISSRI